MSPTGVLYQNSKILIILNLFHMKYTRDPLIFVLFLSLVTYKEYILQISFGRNAG